jgi:hypothetical protein
MNFQMMIINSAAVVDDVAEPVPQPEGRGTEVGRRSLCPPSLRIDPDDSKSPPFEKPLASSSACFCFTRFIPLLWMGKSGKSQKTDSQFVL